MQSVLRERSLSEYAQQHVYIGTSASAGIRPDVTRVYCISGTCQCTSLEYTIIVRKLTVGKRPAMLSMRRTGDLSSPYTVHRPDEPDTRGILRYGTIEFARIGQISRYHDAADEIECLELLRSNHTHLHLLLIDHITVHDSQSTALR